MKSSIHSCPFLPEVEVLRAHGFEAKQQSRGTPAVALATCVAVGMVAMRLASSVESSREAMADLGRDDMMRYTLYMQ